MERAIKNKTVIIPCAGMGKRLGRGIPKALVRVCEEEMILRTLKLLDDVEDVRVVVGYRAEEIIEKVLEHRKDVVFVSNPDYMNTGAGASVLLAMGGAKEYVLMIVGDIIIHPDDMKMILEGDGEFACVTDISSDDSILARIREGKIVGFSREEGELEWTGVAQLRAEDFSSTDSHVYKILEPLLPLPALKIRTKEVDTENDFKVACDWVKNGYAER